MNAWNNKLLIVPMGVVMLLSGWFVYTVWQSSVQKASEWRAADEEMLQLLAQQSDAKTGKQSEAGAARTTAQAKAQSKDVQQPKSTSESGVEEMPAVASDGSPEQKLNPPEPLTAAETKTDGKSKTSPESKVSLNKATKEQLMSLPGIGESKANAIIQRREQLGGRFKTVEQLLDVKGIGDKVLAKLKPLLTIEP
jgi:competence protein ComEA